MSYAHQIYGGYAAQVVVPASVVVPKPPALSFEEAGGLLLAGTTAVHGLSVIGVGSGDTVVVHGASGGVGLMAVQLAVNAGARVIGTASEASHDYLRQLGAEPLTYGEGLVERIRALAPGGVDAAFDTIGSDEAVDASTALVADRGRIVTIAAPQQGFAHGLRVIGGSPGADPGTEIRAAARMELVRQAEAGKLRVRIAATYPLREAAAANRQLMYRSHPRKDRPDPLMTSHLPLCASAESGNATPAAFSSACASSAETGDGGATR